MTATRVFLTGATGRTGGALLRLLRDDPAFEVVPLTRREPPASGDGVSWVRGDLADADDVRRTAKGCDAAFLVWPFGEASAAPPVLDALAEAVDHVVYLSTASVRDDTFSILSRPLASLSAADPITTFHTAIERGLGERDVRATMLRSGGMASNALGWAGQIRTGDAVRWVFGDLGRPLVHEADLADVAALALRDDPAVAGAAPRLTGPGVVTQREQVAQIGTALGRELRWEETAPDVVRAQLVHDGWPAASADGALAGWAAMREHPEPVADVERLTGEPGRSFALWARDHAADFR